jgi:hypothetical protein
MSDAGFVDQVDYSTYYNLESYLFQTVHNSFRDQGQLSAFDFFCIVIWKANRAKSKIAANLLARDYVDLDEAVYDLTKAIAKETTPKDKLRYLLAQWGFRLPMASAVLSVLYPQEFTVYDVRVCGILGEFKNLGGVRDFDELWRGYEEFKKRVAAAVPGRLTLRDNDRLG